MLLPLSPLHSCYDHDVAVAALAAAQTGRPARLRLDRDDDMTITGKRHDFEIEYSVGFDDEGMIHGVDMVLAARCGWSPRDRSGRAGGHLRLPTMSGRIGREE